MVWASWTTAGVSHVESTRIWRNSCEPKISRTNDACARSSAASVLSEALLAAPAWALRAALRAATAGFVAAAYQLACRSRVSSDRLSAEYHEDAPFLSLRLQQIEITGIGFFVQALSIDVVPHSPARLSKFIGIFVKFHPTAERGDRMNSHNPISAG